MAEEADMAVDAEMVAMADEMQAAGNEIQSMVDESLPSVRGMFTQTAMTALVDATNQALEAAGFEGDYPEFTSDVTEFPAEFIRVLAMLADAAEESGAGVNLAMEGIDDDRDVAMLAAQVANLAQNQQFQSMMTEVPEAPAAAPMAAEPAMTEEDLMMQRM